VAVNLVYNFISHEHNYVRKLILELFLVSSI